MIVAVVAKLAFYVYMAGCVGSKSSHIIVMLLTRFIPIDTCLSALLLRIHATI